MRFRSGAEVGRKREPPSSPGTGPVVSVERYLQLEEKRRLLEGKGG